MQKNSVTKAETRKPTKIPTPPVLTVMFSTKLGSFNFLTAIHAENNPLSKKAAKKDGVWTLHYSLITGLDIQANKITIANPYGFVEELSIEDFLKRTSFDAYEKMPLFIKFGFAYAVFEKNALFILEPVRTGL